MKIIQINAWCGKLNAPLRDLIAKESADIVCMQEAFAPDTKSWSVFKDQYGFVNEVLEAGGFNHTFFAPAWGFTMIGSVIDLGNIILSKFPLLAQESFHTNDHYRIAKHYKDLSMGNIRVWQACTVNLPTGKTLSVANYQGYWTGLNPLGDETTIETMKKVRDAVAQLPKPLIFCGDFNITPNSPGMRLLEDLGLTSLTEKYGVKTTLSPVHRAPKNAIESVACDYILASDDISIKSFEVSEQVVSDHKALVMEFEV